MLTHLLLRLRTAFFIPFKNAIHFRLSCFSGAQSADAPAVDHNLIDFDTE